MQPQQSQDPAAVPVVEAVADAAAELAKLKQRLERERRARLQAEAIAEKGLRDLYEKQRQLELLEAVAVAANQASSIKDAFQFAVTRVCAFTEWALGHAYLAEEQGGVRRLRSTSIWHAQQIERVQAFHLATERTDFEAGVGLPGRVLETGAPVWLADVAQAANFPRAQAALQSGIRAAFAFPVLAGRDVVAVLEFFADKVIEPEETLLGLLSQIGTHLGRVVERKRAEDRLIHDASHDFLTGLPNRALFLDRLRRAVAHSVRRTDYRFAVLFVDLDRFKMVNDSLGHRAGDTLITQVAERLLGSLRRDDMLARARSGPAEDGDTLARLGGDEFTLLLEDIADPSDAVRVADRIHDALKWPFGLEGQEVYVTASIGIASSATRYATAEEVLRDADLAMYRAKTTGKARTEVFDQTMHVMAVKRLRLESELRAALLNDRFVLHYQPIVSLGSEEVVGFEALVRWRRSDAELVYPNEFIPVAEDTGLILFIGMWVLREACRTMRQWHVEFPQSQPLTISVNISPRQFVQPDLIEQVSQIIRDTGIDPQTVRLEITETVTMGDAERTISVLTQLRELGVRLSIDDFGTGYSSLSYLHRFPLDVLKIDRSFVSQMDHSSESFQVAETIMNLARNLGMDVVAEGTETTTHVERLKTLGCDYGQGYFFSRPVDAAGVREFLQTPVRRSA